MKLIYIILAFSLSISAFADRPVQSARMGKVGSIHPAAWRISEEVDVKGEGVAFSFRVSISKDNEDIDSFFFTLNKGAKNTKKSNFSIQGDAGSEKFGTEVALECLNFYPAENQVKLALSLKSKILDKIVYTKASHKAKFTDLKVEQSFIVDLNSDLNFTLNDGFKVSIKALKN